MKYLKTFEKYGLENPKKVKKHVKDGSGGARGVFNGLNSVEGYTLLKKKGIKKSLKDLDGILIELKKRFKKYVNVDTIKYLRDGSFGMAFSADDKVIKITTNENEGRVAKSFVGKKLKGCVNYYDVVKIEKYHIIAILMDRAKNLTKYEEKIIDAISDNRSYDHSDDSGIKFLLEYLYGEGITISEKVASKYIKQYGALLNTLEDQGIPDDDLYSGNIGWLKGKLVHFDIMGSTSNHKISKL